MSYLIRNDNTTYNIQNSVRLVPPEYDEVEYIQSNGSQYINTEFIFNKNNDPQIEFDCNAANTGSFHGSQDGSTKRTFCNFNSQTYCGNGSTRISDGRILNERHTYKATYVSSTNTLITYRDNIQVARATQSGSFTNKTIWLFEIIGGSGTTKFSGKIYRVIFIENSVNVRNFIPVKNKSTNEYGMYDLVSKKFFGNSGTGSFTGGQVVNRYLTYSIQNDEYNKSYFLNKNYISALDRKLPSEYDEVEYIEGGNYNYNAYINTGYKANQNTELYIVAKMIAGSGNCNPFGDNTNTSKAINMTFSSSPSTNNTIRFGANYISYQCPIGNNFACIKNNKAGVIVKNEEGDILNQITWTNVANFETINTLSLFKATSSSVLSKVQIKYAYIKDNNVLIREYIPVKRKNDNVYGMYDTVSNTFYSSIGTNAFTGGNIIQPKLKSFLIKGGN